MQVDARAGAAAVVLVIGLALGACASDPPTTSSAVGGGGARTGPTEPAADAFTRPLAPGVTVPLKHNVAVVARGEDPAISDAGLGILRHISAVAVAPDGSVVVADDERGRIVRFRPDGTSELVAGTDQLESTGDGGPATEAGVVPRAALAIGADGTVWIGDDAGLRHIDETGTITTVARRSSGTDQLGPEVLAGSNVAQHPISGVDALTIGPDGRPVLGIARAVYRLEADLTLTHLAGAPGGITGDGGPATAASFENIDGLVVRSDGSMLILDGYARLVREVSPTGTITTWGGVVPPRIDREVGALPERPSAIAAGPDGNAIVTIDYEGKIVQVTPGAVEVLVPDVFGPVAIASFADGSVVYGGAAGVITRLGV